MLMITPLKRIASPAIALLALVAASLAQLPEAPRLRLEVPTKEVVAGQPFQGTAVVTFAPGLHGYQNPPSEDYMIPVKVESRTPAFSVVSVNYPRGVDKVTGGSDVPARVYSGTIRIPFTLRAPEQAGEHTVEISLGYQQCDDQNCYPPDSVRSSFKIVVKAPSAPPRGDPPRPPVGDTRGAQQPGQPGQAGQPPKPAPTEPPPPTQPTPNQLPGQPDKPQSPDTPVSTELGETQIAQPQATSQEPAGVPGDVDGQTPAVGTTEGDAAAPVQAQEESGLSGLMQRSMASGNYVLLFFILFLVGLAVNLTPCVYPLIPVTISFFSSQAGDSRAGRVKLGLMYMAGIAFTYGLVGGVAAGFGAAFGDLFTRPWFLVGLGLLMIVLALSMFDLYQLTIPPALSKHLRGRSGPVGALIMGLLVGVAAAPCAGPVIAAIFAEAAKLQSITWGVLIFTTVGLGLGLPYLILGAATAGVQALPKAGGWMKTVKALLGLIVIGVGLNYLLQAFGMYITDSQKLLIWIAFYVSSAVYLFLFENAGNTRLIMGLKGAAILAFGILAGTALHDRRELVMTEEIQRLQAQRGGPPAAAGVQASNKINWIPFEEQAFNEALGSGKVVVVDGTADWCAECKVIERRVFNQPQSIVAMQDVIAFKVDWSTGVDEAYKKRTQELFDIVGLPHIVFYRPDGQRSEIKTHIATPAEFLEALKRAGASI
jgi:thiol:disulfide interchange protein